MAICHRLITNCGIKPLNYVSGLVLTHHYPDSACIHIVDTL